MNLNQTLSRMPGCRTGPQDQEVKLPRPLQIAGDQPMMSSGLKTPVNQEASFIDHLERIAKHKAGRFAVYAHLSRLLPRYRQPHHLRIATLTFNRLVRDAEGTVFRMSNGDIAVTCKEPKPDELKAPIARLTALFEDDPAVYGATDDAAAFCEVFNLQNQHGTLLTRARALLDIQRSGGDAQLGDSFDGVVELQPIEPAHLRALQTAISKADLSGMLRRQGVCILAPGQDPKPVFFELFTSIESLRKAVLPDINLHSNRWLFQDLTRHLDRRVIAFLARSYDRSMKQAFSINLNVTTLLSKEFLDFDEVLTVAMRRTIVVELHLMDVFADLDAFLFARRFLHDRGYRFCLDGMTYTALPLVDRQRLGVDFVKLIWDPTLKDYIESDKGHALRDAVESVGQGRLILARCDTRLAIETGRKLGVLLYQGHLIDKILRESLKKARSAGTAQPAAPAAAS